MAPRLGRCFSNDHLARQSHSPPHMETQVAVQIAPDRLHATGCGLQPSTWLSGLTLQPLWRQVVRRQAAPNNDGRPRGRDGHHDKRHSKQDVLCLAGHSLALGDLRDVLRKRAEIAEQAALWNNACSQPAGMYVTAQCD